MTSTFSVQTIYHDCPCGKRSLLSQAIGKPKVKYNPIDLWSWRNCSSIFKSGHAGSIRDGSEQARIAASGGEVGRAHSLNREGLEIVRTAGLGSRP